MYLKELELFGFKSFPEKTTLKFEPQVTVIVGPNGCGKSNLLDGLKWALGEQAPKSLRGTKMEDVIFNGTESYPALNYAEVTLTFLNEDNYLPLEYKEVSVARRLYRSGESEYFINKNPVRLKDIEDLFMGTGIGESTYSFIEQGKIELFLSYKPEDKRLMFDEASGIVKYKERKKETLKKLEEAEENLLRLEDILSEVKRQLRYLEKQVEKTKRYKELQEKIVEVEKKIATVKYRELEEKINTQLSELNALKENEVRKDTELNQRRAESDTLNRNLQEIRRSIQELNTQIVSFGAQVETSTNHSRLNQQHIEELEARNTILQEGKKNFGERLSVQEKRLKEEEDRRRAVEETIGQLLAQVEGLKSKKDALLKCTHALEEKITAEKTAILQGEAKRVKMHNTLIEIQTKLSALMNRKKRLLLDKAKIENFLGQTKEKLSEATSATQRIADKVEALKTKRDVLLAQEKELMLSGEHFKEELIEHDKKMVELNSYYEFLRDLQIKYDTFSAKKRITIIFDEEPKGINKLIVSLKGTTISKDAHGFKVVLEAKIIALEEGELKTQIESLQNQVAQMRTKLSDIAAQKQKVTEAISIEQKGIEEETKSLGDALQRKDSLTQEAGRLNEELSLLEEELKASVQEITDLEARQRSLEAELAACEGNLSSAQGNLQKAQELLSTTTEQTKEADITLAQRQAQQESLHKEKESLASKIFLLTEERDNLFKDLQGLEQEVSENLARIQNLKQEIEKMAGTITESKAKIEEALKQRASVEKEEVALMENVESLKDSLRVAEKQADEMRTSLYNKKLEIQGLEFDKEKIKDYLRQVYNIDFDPRLFLEELAIEVRDEGPLLTELNALKERQESLGEVNLVAIEECAELTKRQEFIQKQKDDLINSKENLKKAIQKINRTSKEIFLETFAKIEEEFKNNFRFLFGGGRTQLVLLDEENILESGVEIEVQPPGKKLQNVSLLSGGEKVLTTIALIFAIFRVKPPPICVLDEIDAPLDEANVDRFIHLLKQFAALSQFIIITHNKRTMSTAEVLYGVTMQEKGVSKLVSVKFAEEAKEVAP